MPIPSQTSKIGTKEVYVLIIAADAYHATCKLKRVQVIVVSMMDLEYQAHKEARPETYPRSIIPKVYHDLLDVFFRKDLDMLIPH